MWYKAAPNCPCPGGALRGGSETTRGDLSCAAAPPELQGTTSTVQRDGTAHPQPLAGKEPSSQPSSSSSWLSPWSHLSSAGPRGHPSCMGDFVLYCLGGPAPQTDRVALSSPCQGSSQAQAGDSRVTPVCVQCLPLNLDTTTGLGSEKKIKYHTPESASHRPSSA